MSACVLVRDPRVPAGGFETWVETLAGGLPRYGVRTIVLAPGGGVSGAIAIPASDDTREQARHVLDALEGLAGKGESGVFFTMGYDYLNIAGLNVHGGPWCNVPVLHGRHEGAFEWLAAGLPPKIVVPSRDFASVVRRELRRRVRWFRAMGRVTVIPHGVNVPPIGDKLMRPVGSPVRVVAATRLEHDVKRPLDLTRIALRARERGVAIDLTIAGGGAAEEEMRATGSGARFAGVLSRDAIEQLLIDADILVSTSESEAFGLSIAEALACGCAVVAADAAGPVRELVTAETGRRVPAGDIDAFVTAIAEIAPRARALGRAGRERVARKFARDTMLAAYAALIASLASRCVADPAWRAPAPIHVSPLELTLPPLRTRIRRTLGR